MYKKQTRFLKSALFCKLRKVFCVLLCSDFFSLFANVYRAIILQPFLLKKCLFAALHLICFLFLNIGPLVYARDWNGIAAKVPVSEASIGSGESRVEIGEFIEERREDPPNKYLEELFENYLHRSQKALGDKIVANMYEYRGFQAVKLPANLRLNENPLNNNSWEWNHHNLTAVDYVMSAYLASGKDVYYFDKARELVEGWADHNLNTCEYPSPFSWNDHTTAMRVWRLMYMFEYGRRLPICPDDFLIRLLVLIHHHTKMLAEEEFYNRQTNHGFDQSLALYVATAQFPELSGFTDLNRLAIERLDGEVEFMFTPEGVHVENSIGYHWGLMNSLLRLSDIFGHYGDQQRAIYLSGIIDEAFNFAAFMLKPDGTFPLIGDSILTKLSPLSYCPLQKSHYFNYAASRGTLGRKPERPDAVFPIAGYAIFRDKWHDEQTFDQTVLIFFKCGYLSHFHRQDDDLNVLLTAFGEDWFIDSGRFNYQERRPIRIYMCSNRAHNVPVIQGSDPNRNLRKLRKGTGITAYGFSKNPAASYVEATTKGYPDVDVKRRLEYNKPYHIVITDSVHPLEAVTLPSWSTYFQVPLNKTIELRTGSLKISADSGNSLTMTFPSESKASIFSGCENPIQGCRSETMGQSAPIQTIVISHPLGKESARFEVQLEYISNANSE